MKQGLRALHAFMVVLLAVVACNLPSNQAGGELGLTATAAALTLQALTSATATPTVTLGPPPPSPTVTVTSPPPASPTSNCNVAQFITDVTIPDGTIMAPSQAFTKKWRLKNIGSCTWNGFQMTFDSGDSMSGPASKPVPTVNPGQEIDLDVNLTAPASVGNYRGYWRIVTNNSVLVPVVNGYQGKSFYVDIKVQNPATPTNTLPPAIVFAVTSVTFDVTGSCPNFNYTVHVTVNGAGTVNLHRVFSDGGTDTAPRTLTFASAGTQSFSEPVYFGVNPGSEWTDIYVDSPNHQQFGRATFTCP